MEQGPGPIWVPSRNWREAYNLGHATGTNYTIAQRVLWPVPNLTIMPITILKN